MGECVCWSVHDSDLDRHVVDVQAEGDPLVEGELRLSSAVDVHGLLGLDVALLMVDAGLDHTVADGLHRRQKTCLKRATFV